MRTLSDLQQAFQAHVLYGARGIEHDVTGTERLDTETRLGIYRNAILARLVEALSETYPALRHAMGEREFAALTHAFAKQSPPAHFSIRYFGRNLASFISSELTGIKSQVLSDLAHWEWALSEAFDAADAAALTQTAFARIEPEQWGELRLHLSPSLRRLCLRSNAVQWWRAASQGARRPTRWRRAAPVEWVIWRSDLTTRFRSLEPDEAWGIDLMAAGEPFAVLCEGLSQFHRETEVPVRAAMLLKQWMSDELIVGLGHTN